MAVWGPLCFGSASAAGQSFISPLAYAAIFDTNTIEACCGVSASDAASSHI